ncbi:MAG: undecaprenyl-diphosphate phosphatase [Gammaproteobacteria bacterium]|nr:MAG: undecaprenyl-diphosphate phosphatase [Gammaproteobacteria bacterium]
MDLIQILVLALVQGLTEFLPISSSAHLILLPKLVGWTDQGLAFDVAVHVGTLCAVVLYMRHEIKLIIYDWFRSISLRRQVGESPLAWGIIIGTLPAGLAGLLMKDTVENLLRSPLVIAGATLIFGILLWIADYRAKCSRDEHVLSWIDCLLIGTAQAIALIPGTSRSGITITAGLMLGLNRQAAARFSFLLSIPLILAAGLLKIKDLLDQAGPVDWTALYLGALISGISAYMCIHLFLKLLQRMTMTPFVIYRILLSGLLFYIYL